jgi:dienelactone hydrolase
MMATASSSLPHRPGRRCLLPGLLPGLPTGLLALAVALLAPAAVSAQDVRLPLIEPGRHGVGWKVFVRTDLSRPYADAFTRPGPGARPVLFSVWYPARVPAGTARLKQGDYLRLENLSPPSARFLQHLQALSRRVVTDEIAGNPFYWPSDAGNELARRHLARETLATRNPPPAPGRFPLLIYHPGLAGYFADSSPLLEHLASHGFVVVSSAFQPDSPASLRIDADLLRSRSDVAFIVSQMRNDPQVDPDHLGLLGHSYGATASLASAMGNHLVGAVASIDSTLDYQPVRALPLEGDWSQLLQAERLRAPSLFFASRDNPRRPVGFDLVETFAASERLLVEIDGVPHDSFIWHGPSGASLRADPAAARYLDAYRTVILFTQQFFDAHLKQNDRAIAFLDTQAEEGPGFHFRRMPGSRPQPSATELAAGLLARGTGPGAGWLEARIKKDALPYALMQDVMAALQEREHAAAARAVGELSVRVYADNPLACEQLGDLQVRERLWDQARDSYQTAVKRLRSVQVRPAARKAMWRQRLTAKLDRLKTIQGTALR